MERIVGVDERIRRAEELYNRRKMQGGIRVSTNNVNNSSRSGISLFKKMIIKIIICAIIYFIFYILKNSGMFFSKEIIDQTQKIMGYDINIKHAYSQVIKLYNDNVVAKNENKEINNEVENQDENINNETQSNLENNQEVLGIGGADTSTVDIIESAPAQGEVIQKTQMEIDAEYIKSNLSLIKPSQGEVTSRFGLRTATEIISANHQGIDIGANTGTPIYASMDGTVIKVANYGDYGKHLIIQNGEITTLYAHCNKLNVSNGQVVKQGEKIAEMGSTGRTTGPHLHFEIQREGRVINPEYLLEF